MSAIKGTSAQLERTRPDEEEVDVPEGSRTRQLQEMSTLSSEVAAPAVPVVHSQAEMPEMVICPRKGWIAIDWSELWRHRELLYFLVWRDVKVRYKQALLGVAWAVLAPVITVAIFTF